MLVAWSLQIRLETLRVDLHDNLLDRLSPCVCGERKVRVGRLPTASGMYTPTTSNDFHGSAIVNAVNFVPREIIKCQLRDGQKLANDGGEQRKQWLELDAIGGSIRLCHIHLPQRSLPVW